MVKVKKKAAKKPKAEKLTKLVIDRNVWLRGEGMTDSYLYRAYDKKMCCVGIYLNQCGVKLSTLKNQRAADSIRSKVPTQCNWLIEGMSPVPYTENDSTHLTEAGREKEIAKAFKAAGITVEFKN